ncbi:DUF5683 domain-containing protein [Paraflavisolibacter sp. H34]|uniref:DUF5683 domain-containing protein n=1 Tax=Huijunlia imazamoxiresistens TaxID=3127457 RepID=UPI00301B0F68
MTRNVSLPFFQWLLGVLLLVFCQTAAAQEKRDTLVRADTLRRADTLSRPVPADSLPKVAQPAPPATEKKVDSAANAFSPRKAIIRSAILPGWGQIYNKKYWKLPLVYGALGVTGYVFVTNLQTYRDLRFAYQAKYKASQSPADSSDYFLMKPEYVPVGMESLRYNRDNFRRYIDYSVLFFVLFWGLNVVDAAVDAHLKSFDVSPDLALKFKAGRSQMAGTTGIGLVLAFK